MNSDNQRSYDYGRQGMLDSNPHNLLGHLDRLREEHQRNQPNSYVGASGGSGGGSTLLPKLLKWFLWSIPPTFLVFIGLLFFGAIQSGVSAAKAAGVLLLAILALALLVGGTWLLFRLTRFILKRDA